MSGKRSILKLQNYFNYFTEIEEQFQRRRGSLLLLSTLDWALIETWKDAGIPLEAVLRGMSAARSKALGALLPPKEKRGLIFIDPPFEAPGEFARLADGLLKAHRKWPTGIYLLWYPIKEPDQTKAFAAKIVRLKVPKILRTELRITGASDQEQLLGSGLLIVNPPWTLESELKNLLPALTLALRRDAGGRCNLGWLVPEK